MDKIVAIVFDVGGILLPLDWREVQRQLSLNDESFKKLSRDILEWDLHHQYERGEINSNQFINALIEKVGMKLEPQLVIKAWNGFVGDVFPEMAQLIRTLKKTKKVYTLSNINELHLDHILKRNSIFAEIDRFFASHEMGARKPEQRIYEKLLHEIQCAPQETLFFDDNEDNIKKAKALGMNAFHITQPLKEIPEHLSSLGIL